MDKNLLKARHPEKQKNSDRYSGPKPPWIRVKAPVSKGYQETLRLKEKFNLTTICEEASCPNISECWKNKHASFMILGDVCTRACSFCNVKTGLPDQPLDLFEPINIAMAVVDMNLSHVVITSVDRDDLDDGGAEQFSKVIQAIRDKSPSTTVEILTPDFRDKPDALEIIVQARPDVFNHNLETVPSLYPDVRPGARYYQSLRLLDQVKQRNENIFTKSGLMVGLGETKKQLMQVMDDLRVADVDFLTLGQYLQPTLKHLPVARFVTPDEFDEYAKIARSKGFLMVSSTPLTRSSYHADKDFERLKKQREKKYAS